MQVLSIGGIHRLLATAFAGEGIILTFHRVRPGNEASFQPNRHLEIEPEFLRAVLKHVRSIGLDIISLDELHRRLSSGELTRRFVCLTFDDGYRDNRDYALPIMREFEAPFSVNVTTDFAAGTGWIWWVALEQLVARTETIRVEGLNVQLHADSDVAKQVAFSKICGFLRSLPAGEMRLALRELFSDHGIDDVVHICRDLCMSWAELKSFAADPLVTIGAHTIDHCRLSGMDEAEALHQLAGSRAIIEEELEQPIWHLAYPFGSKADAGPREFGLARKSGFKTAVTTQPGVILASHASDLTALPRVSINGDYQDERFLPVLTSGVGTGLWNVFKGASPSSIHRSRPLVLGDGR